MLPNQSRCWSALLAVLCSGALAKAAPARDQELLERVTARLLDVMEPLPESPQVRIAGEGLRVSTVLRRDKKGKRTVITLNADLMDRVVKGDADVLAFIVAHQLSRLAHRHPLAEEMEDGSVVKPKPLGEKEEAQAEWSAAELLVRSGFSLRRGLRGPARLQDADPEAHSFDGRAAGLPLWEKRLEVFDREQLPLAKLMSAWDAGAVFLVTEQFFLAELCLERVTQEFPAASDAWAGLGYARLMLYFDRLTKDELDEYGVGMVVSRGFLRRGTFAPLVGGKRLRLWIDAVEALHEGLRQNPRHTRARAALGLAYLFHPHGRELDRALEHLQAAADASGKDPLLSRRERGAILANLAAARAANGQTAESGQAMTALEKLHAKEEPLPLELRFVLAYQRAVLLSEKKDRAARAQAIEQFAGFLREADALSMWWELALARHDRLCREEGKEPLDRDKLLQQVKQRMQGRPAVRFDPDPGVGWRDPPTDAVRKLGAARSVTVVRGANVRRLVWDRAGLELLAAEAIFAIRLGTEKSPALVLDDGRNKRRLSVGMKVLDLDRVLGADCLDWTFFEADRSFHFYPELGLAVRIAKERVVEIVVVPRSEL